MNIIDKIYNIFSPQTAEKRLLSRKRLELLQKKSFNDIYNNRFRSGRIKNRESVTASLAGMELVRNEIRKLNQQNSVCAGIIGRLVGGTIGNGISPQILIKKDINADIKVKVKQQIKDNWDKWALNQEVCDSEKRNDFYQLQRLIVNKFFEDGEIFILIAKSNIKGQSFSIQLLEADQVNSNLKKNPDNGNEIIYGVEIDKNTSAPVAYYVSTNTENPYTNQKRIPKYDSSGNVQIFHLFESKRPGQTRGYSKLAPAIKPLQDIERYSDSEIMATIIASCYGITITTPRDATSALPIESEGTAYEQDFEPGFVQYLNPGEDIKAFEFNRPSGQFSNVIFYLMSQISIAVGIPFVMLFLDFEKINFSSARYAGIEAFRIWKQWQDFFVNHFIKHIFSLWLNDQILFGNIVLPSGLTINDINAVFYGPRYIHIDPQKEQQANEIALKLNTTTLANLIDDCDWQEQVEQRVIEISYIIETAKKYNVDPNLLIASKNTEVKNDNEEV